MKKKIQEHSNLKKYSARRISKKKIETSGVARNHLINL
jgi:hypothetical protein|tara:strand:+ start:68 stop:181 length:114 start_codon:yes stop_codon:yes gene_type:complete